MSSHKRVILMILWGAVAMIVLVGAGGWIWWKHSGEALLAQGREARGTGLAFGRSASASQCVDEVLRQHAAAAPGIGTAIAQSVFFSGCLETASAVDTLCAAAPAHGVMEDARWIASLCAAHGVRDQYCPQVLQPLAQACRRPAASGSPG